MRSLIVCIAVLHICFCVCPDGFDIVKNGECRGKYARMSSRRDLATNLAISQCAEMQGTPVIIHSDEDQLYWKGVAGTTGSGYSYILGLVCNTSSLKWQWSDGSSVEYKPAGSYDTSLNSNCVSGCVWYSSSNGGWNKYCDSNSQTFDIDCITQLIPPVASGDECEDFENDSDDGVCYQIGATAESWRDAQVLCRTFGGNLASVHNVPQENSFIRRLAVSRGLLSGVYLGALVSGKGCDFDWVDGSAWDYQHFYPGFPMNGLGDCLVMDTESATGDWVNVDCNATLSVACMRRQNFSYAASICPTETQKEGVVIASPGYPYDASTPCDYILMVEAGKQVEVEVYMLEANSCCDRLVLVENYIGGKEIASLTGSLKNRKYKTTSSNFMRVSWQPNGGVNVRGAMFSFRAV